MCPKALKARLFIYVCAVHLYKFMCTMFMQELEKAEKGFFLITQPTLQPQVPDTLYKRQEMEGFIINREGKEQGPPWVQEVPGRTDREHNSPAMFNS